MAVQFLDSCGDHYSQVSDMISKWTWAQFATIVPGRNGNGILLQPGAGIISKSLKHRNIWITGFAIFFDTGSNFGAAGNVYVASNTGAAIFSIQIQPDGSVTISTNGPAGTVIGSTATLDPPFYCQPMHWYFFEVKFEIFGGDNVSVVASLNIDGASLLVNKTGDTGYDVSQFVVPQGTANFHQFFGANVTGGIIIDDVNIKDTDGAFAVDFLGDLAIFCLYPRADITTQWTGLIPGNQFSQINSHTPLGDSTYVYASQPPDSPLSAFDNFFWEPIPTFFGDLFCVQMSVYARKDAEGTRAIQSVAGGSGQVSDVFYLDDDYSYYIFPMSDNSGTKWTITDFNAKSFGFLIAE